MPKKKTNGDSTEAPVSKTQFVLSLPADTPADEVIAKAKDSGISISKTYVYTIRAKSKTGGKAKRRGRPPGKAKAPNVAAQGKVTSPRAGGSLETQFADIVAQIGLARAAELLRSVQAKFASAVS
jgi:hypothetical protein